MTDARSRSRNLENIFYPRSIAVVGANRIAGTVPHDILLNIVRSDYQGVVYPVHPKERAIASLAAYKYVVDIKDPVDLAVIVFPSSVVDLALEQCGQKGINSVIIISAGFKEVGGTGLEREQKLKEIAARYNISFIGPNCLGVINTDPDIRLNASFARRMPEEGSIAFLSQSGALCTAVLDYAFPRHIGFSKFVSFGNKADISEIDLLHYLKDDEKTKVILLYLEEITDGRALMQASREIISEKKKPILLLKSGRTAEGASAAASHTGSLAGSDRVCDAAMKQAGIIRCSNIEEMFNKAIALAYQPLPRRNRVAIITNAGGPGVLATDAAIQEGLSLARFSEKTLEGFKRALPKTANIKNPVDVIGDSRADRYRVALSGVLEDDDVDGAFVILTPQSMTDIESIAHEITLINSQSRKPLYASFMGELDVAAGIDILEQRKIPHYRLPESMSQAFAAAYHFMQTMEKGYTEPAEVTGINKEEAHRILSEAVRSRKSFLTEDESVKVLEAFGLPVPAHGICCSEEEACSLAHRIGYPVVMKVLSEDIIHKSEVHGVIVDIKNEKELRNAYKVLQDNLKAIKPAPRIKGFYMAQMLNKGHEVILGIKQDPSFGPVIMFGLGGIFVEIFNDISFAVAPVTREEVRAMVRGIRSFPILSGSRGKKVYDIKGIEECLERLSCLAVECPEIKELDINPLIVLEEGGGCFVADARIML